jgi:hypothetical protein
VVRKKGIRLGKHQRLSFSSPTFGAQLLKTDNTAGTWTRRSLTVPRSKCVGFILLRWQRAVLFREVADHRNTEGHASASSDIQTHFISVCRDRCCNTNGHYTCHTFIIMQGLVYRVVKGQQQDCLKDSLNQHRKISLFRIKRLLVPMWGPKGKKSHVTRRVWLQCHRPTTYYCILRITWFKSLNIRMVIWE